eukprot:UN01655
MDSYDSTPLLESPKKEIKSYNFWVVFAVFISIAILIVLIYLNYSKDGNSMNTLNDYVESEFNADCDCDDPECTSC